MTRRGLFYWWNLFLTLDKEEKTDKTLYIYLQHGRDRANTGNYLGWETFDNQINWNNSKIVLMEWLQRNQRLSLSFTSPFLPV